MLAERSISGLCDWRSIAFHWPNATFVNESDL